jgi:flagellar hook capping protein FlgD
MPRTSICIALLTAFALLPAPTRAARPRNPGPVTWSLVSPDAFVRVIRVAPVSAKPPELGIDWPATVTRVPLDATRDAWIWDIPRAAIPPAAKHTLGENVLASPLPDVTCFDCRPEDEDALGGTIGKAKERPADASLPKTPIALVISDTKVYPNPFNPFLDDAVISGALSEDAEVTITAYDWNGQFVATVFRGPWAAGANQVRWGGQTEDGRKLGNGVYLLRIVADDGARKEDQVLKVAVWNER